MARRTRTDEDWDDDWDGDWGDDADSDDDVISCPYCERPIYEESERCPHCGQYISEEDAPSKPKPLWIILGALACLLVVVVWILIDAFG
jgi:predicted nucleic acid-binding Zn ribbon protein